jgi:hypothetical protein
VTAVHIILIRNKYGNTAKNIYRCRADLCHRRFGLVYFHRTLTGSSIHRDGLPWTSKKPEPDLPFMKQVAHEKRILA